MHRDSLGTELPIRPGELNWMTAGRGIVHSERTAPELRATGRSCSASRAGWRCRLEDEETAPGFVHYDAGEMPVLDGDGKTVRIIAGSILGASRRCGRQARCSMPTWCSGRGPVPLDPDYDERAI